MISDEKQKVLDMLEQGSITAEEAARLLDALEAGAKQERSQRSEQMHSDAKRMQGKKLRVEVNGFVEGDKRINVNVSVPLVLARYADNIIANCVPKDVNRELSTNGIDLSQLKIGELVDTFESLEEDIVNADIDQEDTKLKVRVYVD
ncbi:SHOCT-like domain-containing protein [Gehongia tenuis]|uniref:YvlB/LiaX N-terminal domain-containing protein n=1 Tax=Gehongia tenuis TaxID=2763655 RepID=A0A926D3A2_9FIRM|nr:hypothetical protein [Gehongia tenuis]MBC8530456.1 hypothetical protein [Gehongia tenuis]